MTNVTQIATVASGIIQLIETGKEIYQATVDAIEVKGTLILDDANSVTIKDESGIEKKIAKSNIRDIVIDLDKPDERPITIKSYEEPETEIETETEAEIVRQQERFRK